MESGINKVPIVILATMFEKANELLWREDLIVKKPGADSDLTLLLAIQTKSTVLHLEKEDPLNVTGTA